MTLFYSHVNYSVTKIYLDADCYGKEFYSHVNYSVTKIVCLMVERYEGFTVT